MPLKIRTLWKVVLSIAVALIGFKFYVLRLVGGGANIFNPELPVWVLLPVTWLFAVLMFFSLWLLVWEAIALAGRLFKRKISFSWKRNLAGFILASLLVTFGMWQGMKSPQVTRQEIILERLPEELDGLTIAHLSDIHVDTFTDAGKVDKIVRMTNELGADLVVITGDFVDGRIEVRGEELRGISNLNARLGVFGVAGNHEYYSGYDQWMELLRSCGIRMLVNQHVMLTPDLALGGTADLAAKRRGGELPDVEKTFMGVPPEAVKILLAHQPKLVDEAVKNKVDLQLSGHTHGGMIYGMDLLVGAFNKGVYSGLYDVEGTRLFISNGTGIWNGFPLRLGRKSEIVLLTLKKAEKK